jgi:hypothetical protein
LKAIRGVAKGICRHRDVSSGKVRCECGSSDNAKVYPLTESGEDESEPDRNDKQSARGCISAATRACPDPWRESETGIEAPRAQAAAAFRRLRAD